MHDSSALMTSQTSPATGYEIVNFVDGVHRFSRPVRGLSFAVAGTIRGETLEQNGGDPIPSGSLAAGVQHGCVWLAIYEVGTTATGLVGWF